MCLLCLRTCVHHVPGLYRRVKIAQRFIAGKVTVGSGLVREADDRYSSIKVGKGFSVARFTGSNSLLT